MDIFDYLKQLHEECIKNSEHIVFEKKHPRHLYLVGLYGSLIELTGSLIILIENKCITGALPVFRSLLEAYVEFHNLHADAKYGYYMEISYHEQWLKVLEKSKETPNPFLKEISEANTLDKMISKEKSEIKELKNKGYKALNILQRFKKAEMVDEYCSIYNFLSNDAHSNIRALIDRHLEIEENSFTVVYYKEKSLENNLHILDSASGLLLKSSLKIHHFFDTPAYLEIEKSSKKLDKIRSKYCQSP